MRHFIRKLLYRTFLIYITLPKNAKNGLSIQLDRYILAKDDHANIVPFLEKFPQLAEQNALSFQTIHNLSWLCDIEPDTPIANMQHIHAYLKDNLKEYVYYDTKKWQITLLSERLFYALHAFSVIFSPAATEYSSDALILKNDYLRMMIKHATYLRRYIKHEKKTDHYILLLIRSGLASIMLHDERRYLHHILSMIETELDQCFSIDGGHVTRNTNLHFQILVELICLRDALIKAGVKTSLKIQRVIALSCDFLSFLRHPDKRFSIFNNPHEGSRHDIDRVFSYSPGAVNTPINMMKEAGFYRLEQENTFILADFYHASLTKYQPQKRSLSFEMSVGEHRVFINCGENYLDMEKQDSYNTISLQDYAISMTHKDPHVTGKKSHKVISAMTSKGIALEGAAHLKAIPLHEKGKTIEFSHYRKILLHKGGGILQGEDWVCVSNDLIRANKHHAPKEALCRFHLSPSVSAKISKTGSVILSIPGERDKIFNSGSGKISLEDAVYFGKRYPEKIQQIIIRVPLNNETTKIRWALQTIQAKKEKISEEELEAHHL